MNEARVRDPEEALAHRAESRLGRRPSLFRAFVTGQQSFEIDAVKLAPPIQDDDLRQSPVTAHAFSQNHHAGTITGRVEGHVEREDAPAEGVDQESHPRPPENLARMARNYLHVQLGVIDVPNLERTVPVPGRLQIELDIEGFLNICRPPPLPF